MVLIQYFRFADKMECVIMTIDLCLMLLAIHHYKYKKATIEDMYTAPKYRKQGIAIHTLDLLVKEAREQGVR